MLQLEDNITKMFLDQIKDLNRVNLEEVIEIMIEIKKDDEKI